MERQRFLILIFKPEQLLMSTETARDYRTDLILWLFQVLISVLEGTVLWKEN